MKFLLVDIGAGTMDVLYVDDQSPNHFKAVVQSPVRTLAEKIAATAGDLVVVGCEMGGGAVSGVLRQRARQDDVAVTAAAAATLHHDPATVAGWGVRVVDDREADDLVRDPRYSPIRLGDLEMDRLRTIVEGFGVPFAVDVMAVCAQDHGVPPRGVSHLDYRHNLFKARLDAEPFPHALLYGSDAVPATFNRLCAIARSAAGFPAAEAYVMDSGMAAILGASMEPRASDRRPVMVLDVATSHTVAAVLTGRELAGFFEYHTHDITPERLASLLPELADGNLTHQAILAEGGHGAYIRRRVGFEHIESIIATGPRRGLIHGMSLPILWGAPFGDNMMTGTTGLLEAVRRRKRLEPMSYI